MIDYPFYLYGNSEFPSPEDSALFHYTKFESFMDIIETMTLRTSPLRKMNDLNDANLDNLDWMALDLTMMDRAQEYVKEQCSIISFTKNYMKGPICEEGTNHPAMWAHYADDSNGVCIVLDKDSLLANNRGLLEKHFYRIESVDYGLHCVPNNEIMYSSYSDVSGFVQTNYRELFYKKHIDWQYENEERFFIESPEEYLNIKGAIKYIVLGGRVRDKEDNLAQIVQQMITPATKSYRYFNIHSFVEMMPSVDGYLALDASSIVLEQIRTLAQTDHLAKDYLEWERDSFSLVI